MASTRIINFPEGGTHRNYPGIPDLILRFSFYLWLPHTFVALVARSQNCLWFCDMEGTQSSVQWPVMSDSWRRHGLQQTRLLCLSPTSRAHSNSCPSSEWCHPTISSSVIPFSSYLQSLPASGSFPVSPFFTSGGQIIGVLALASVLPMNIQGWFPLGWTGWISLQSKGLSRVFSNTTVQKHQFFRAQLSLWSNSHIHTWLMKNP